MTVPPAIGLGNGTVVLTGAAVIDTWRAIGWVIKKARSEDNILAARVLQLERVLAAEAGCVAGRGQQDAPQPVELHASSDVIDTAAAAAMLRVSPRTLRRRAAEFGGRQIAGRWTFDPLLVSAVAEKGD